MIILAEFEPLDTVAGSRVTLRATNADHPDVTGLNSVRWWPALSDAPTVSIRLFKGDFDGQIEPGQASLTLRADGLEKLSANARRFRWAGAPVRFYAGNAGQAWPWTQVFEGLVERFEGQGNAIKVTARVDTEPFQKDVLTAKYAGTGGIEGGADLKNKPKPFLLGRCVNVEPVLINAVDNVYQVSAYGAIQAVSALYERASSFGASVGDYATYAALVAATIPAGRWGTCLASGLIRLGAPAFGVITADVDGDKGGGTWWRKTGEIIARIASNSGISGSVIDSASLTALDTALAGLSNQGRIGIYITEQENVLDLAARLAAPCNAQAGISLTGKLFAMRASVTSPTMTLDAQARQLPAVLSSIESDVSPPYTMMEFGWGRAWRVHSFSEIAFYAELIDRGAYSASETYREGNIVQDQGSSWLYINPTATAGNAPPTLPTTSNAYWKVMAVAGDDGASAKGVTVTATSAFFPFDAAGAAISQTVTFKAVRQNTTVQTQWTIRDRAGGSVTGNAAYIASTFPTSFTRVDDDTLTMTHTQFVAWIAGGAVRETTTVEATITDGVTVSDSVTIQKADASAVLPVLTNQADNVAADAAGNVASFAGLGGTMKLFAGGSTPITSGITFSLVSSTGVTVTINSSTGVYAPTAMSASTGTATLRAAYAGKTYDLIYSISKAIAGTAGTNGTNGTNGIDGAQGISSRIVFQRAATVPATPAASAGTPSGWYDTTTAVPAGSNPMWSTTGSTPLGGGNFTWGAPVLVEAISANQTGESTGAFYTTSATLSFVLNPGQSRNVYIQGDVPSPTGSGNVYPQIEYREAGGSWSASNGSTWFYFAGDPIDASDLNHSILVANSTFAARTYEVRGTIVRSNTNSGALTTALSFLRI